MTMKINLFVIVLLTFSVSAIAGPREDWQVLTDSIAASGNHQAAERINEALSKLSDEEIQRIYGNTDLLTLADKFLSSTELTHRATTQYPELAPLYATPQLEVGDDSTGRRDKGAFRTTIQSAGLPGAVGYPTAGWCPFSPNRSDADALLIAQDVTAGARVLLETAKGVWAGLSRACDEVLFGFNGSLACIPADIVLAAAELVVGAAETVVEHIDFCDAAVDAAEIEASYERVGHLHTDLDGHVVALGAHDTAISNQVSAHDTAISTQVAAHDTNITNQMAAHHAAITAQIATHDAEIKARLDNIQGTVDENQRLIKVGMSRQLEVLRLLITSEGQRGINMDVLTCTGDDCPTVADLQCSKGGLGWPCK
jgi:hypothetical protein